MAETQAAKRLREYETIFLVKPDLTDDNVDSIKERVRGIVNREGGKLIRFTVWGKKKTLYPIAKQPRAIYVHTHYLGELRAGGRGGAQPAQPRRGHPLPVREDRRRDRPRVPSGARGREAGGRRGRDPSGRSQRETRLPCGGVSTRPATPRRRPPRRPNGPSVLHEPFEFENENAHERYG